MARHAAPRARNGRRASLTGSRRATRRSVLPGSLRPDLGLPGIGLLRRAEVQVVLGGLVVALVLALVGSLLPLGSTRTAAASGPGSPSVSQLIQIVAAQQTPTQDTSARDRAAAMAWLDAMQQMQQLTAADHIKITLVPVPGPSTSPNAIGTSAVPTGPLGRVIPNQVTLNVSAADQLLASLPASMSLLDRASLIKTTDQIGNRDAEWSRADRRVYPNTPRATAVQLLSSFGFNLDQWGCLDRMWWEESNWNPLDGNQASGAYGIPQSLPADKMAAAGSDWQTNPTTQIRWGLAYISARYGSPCQAWSFWTLHYWY